MYTRSTTFRLNAAIVHRTHTLLYTRCSRNNSYSHRRVGTYRNMRYNARTKLLLQHSSHLYILRACMYILYVCERNCADLYRRIGRLSPVTRTILSRFTLSISKRVQANHIIYRQRVFMCDMYYDNTNVSTLSSSRHWYVRTRCLCGKFVGETNDHAMSRTLQQRSSTGFLPSVHRLMYIARATLQCRRPRGRLIKFYMAVSRTNAGEISGRRHLVGVGDIVGRQVYINCVEFFLFE